MDQQHHIKTIIQDQVDTVCYDGFDCTRMHRLCMYRAFLQILENKPLEMMDYLINRSRSHKLQHQIFQAYINLLEKQIPFTFYKDRKPHHITSLLDNDLGIFNGVSVFQSIITDKYNIKNETEEVYIGGRSAHHVSKYYIGKLLDVVNANNGQPLMNCVKGYSFHKIYMNDVIPGTNVMVSHLRIPPHYQMGGMVYLNRIRKKIVEAI